MNLLGYATYLPSRRLELGRTSRIVASFDEDATTMAVEAAIPIEGDVRNLFFVTSSPPYLDKTNATAVHAALHLAPDVPAADLIGTARSTMSAVRSAAAVGGLVVAADVRVGRPGSADERGGADGSAALLFGAGEPIAEVLAQVGRTDEFLDRWRDPAKVTGEQWEERFGFERYASLIRLTAASALAAAGLAEADHVVLTCPNSAVVKRAGTLVKGALSTGGSPVGFAGSADPLLGLAHALDTAGPEETILLLSATDGCDALLLRTTAALPDHRQPAPVRRQKEGGRPVPMTTYLSWRGLLELEPPRRPEPDRPAAPPAARGAGWKFGLTGTRCRACGFVHLPPARVCRGCGAVDAMAQLPVGGLRGTVATYTVDRLAYSPSPPVVDVVVDFGSETGSGRSTFEVADADPDAICVGTPVRFVFRRLFTAGGVHNYFWKARVVEDVT